MFSVLLALRSTIFYGLTFHEVNFIHNKEACHFLSIFLFVTQIIMVLFWAMVIHNILKETYILCLFKIIFPDMRCFSFLLSLTVNTCRRCCVKLISWFIARCNVALVNWSLLFHHKVSSSTNNHSYMYHHLEEHTDFQL